MAKNHTDVTDGQPLRIDTAVASRWLTRFIHDHPPALGLEHPWLLIGHLAEELLALPARDGADTVRSAALATIVRERRAMRGAGWFN
jgi:hypothetical protein